MVAWVVSGVYTLYLNPEVVHYAGGSAIKAAWAGRMTAEHGAKTIAIGGSSCEFSFDGERMLTRFGLPFVNYGWQVGMGAAVITESALRELQPGDTLIVAIEPFLLTVPLDQPSLGVQLSIASRHPEWASEPVLGVGGVGWFQMLASLRPGGYHAFTLLGKFVRRDPLYRYQGSDYHASGWKQTAVRVPFDGPAWHKIHLSEDSRQLLRRLREWCDRHGVRAAYSLPWSYTPADAAHRFREENLEFLVQMSAFFPVLRDARVGVDPVREHYSDTALHLTESGAALRSDELAGQIRNWDVWTTADLRALQSR